MRFGLTLQSSVYEPWKDSYLHYARLKNMLYEGQSDGEWGERDESRFVEELDSELEKASCPFQSIKSLTLL
jgi:SPX domain protein involved in polyphosphate accumulation